MSQNKEKNIIEIKLKRISKNSKIPFQAYKNDAGYDCFINEFTLPIFDKEKNKKILMDLKESEYFLNPLDRIGCKLGFATAIPEGYYAAVVPRSGLALWEGLSIVNSPGTIDAGYRNEWIANVVNISKDKIHLEVGEKICQFIIQPIIYSKLILVNNFTESDNSKRGMNGFGSSGK